jgi:NHS family xanthosine MFS transporter
LGIVLGFYAFTLPKCKTNKKQSAQSWIDTLGLRAFSLFKEKRMAIFFLFSMLLGMSLQITNGFAESYIRGFGKISEFTDTFGVKHATILISLSQISETLCILLIPFFLRRFGIKIVMLISMFAWVFRFGLLGAGNPGNGLWMLILSMLVYGVAFDFFNISGSLFVDKETHPSIRSSAQGVFMIMTNGFGAFIGSYLAGFIVDRMGWPLSWYIFAAFALAVGLSFIFVFKDTKSKIAS